MYENVFCFHSRFSLCIHWYGESEKRIPWEIKNNWKLFTIAIFRDNRNTGMFRRDICTNPFTRSDFFFYLISIFWFLRFTTCFIVVYCSLYAVSFLPCSIEYNTLFTQSSFRHCSRCSLKNYILAWIQPGYRRFAIYH